MVTESPECVYVGYSSAELKAQKQAEYQANAALKALSNRWVARAKAEREAMAAAAELGAKWQQAAAVALEHAPFPLVRVKLRGKVAPVSRIRLRSRPAYMSQRPAVASYVSALAGIEFKALRAIAD